MDLEPPPNLGLFGLMLFLLFSSNVFIPVLALIVLIIFSALISGSEIAFFSLSSSDIAALNQDDSPSAKKIISLRKSPRKLLATILIANNLVNISIVLISDIITRELIGNDQLNKIGAWLYAHGFSWAGTPATLAEYFNLLVTVIGATAILVLFGEIAPKIYANINNLKFARMMASPISFLKTFFSPVSGLLVKFSSRIESKLAGKNMSTSNSRKEDLDAAIDITVVEEGNSEGEADILKGIVKFGDVSTRQIMKSRVDVVALDIDTPFDEVLKIIKQTGYSRIPVYKEDFDNLEGILYVKDLLGHTDKGKDFNWNNLIRKSILYVPESKKIDDLLKEFQSKRTHIAIVVDEYGGSQGIVTLEDVLEEVIGDIKDEFDESDELDYIKVGPDSYIFEGKSLLNDVCRIIDVDTNYFDEVKGESDSLAGLIIEMTGSIPKKDTEVKYKDICLKVISVSNRRIEKINLQKNHG